jgi:hypothetical protein
MGACRCKFLSHAGPPVGMARGKYLASARCLQESSLNGKWRRQPESREAAEASCASSITPWGREEEESERCVTALPALGWAKSHTADNNAAWSSSSCSLPHARDWGNRIERMVPRTDNLKYYLADLTRGSDFWASDLYLLENLRSVMATSPQSWGTGKHR